MTAPSIVHRRPWDLRTPTWLVVCCPRFDPRVDPDDQLTALTYDGWEFTGEDGAVRALAEHLRCEHGVPALSLVVIDLVTGSTARPDHLPARSVLQRRRVAVPTAGA